jgi:hypothetical protein
MTDCKYVIVYIINLQAYTYIGERGRSKRGQANISEVSMVEASGVSRVEAQGCIEQGRGDLGQGSNHLDLVVMTTSCCIDN